MSESLESIQLLNTAIIKLKEKNIDSSYEDRLRKLSESPSLEAINKAISHLAETKKVSRDQAAFEIIETIKELEKVWTEYIIMEGIDKLKSLLKTHN